MRERISTFYILLFFLFILTACRTDTSFRGTELPQMPSTDFTLTDQYGDIFTLSEHKGKAILMFFGFTYCPDVCPLTLSSWKKVEAYLGKDADKVKFVYITVDPQRDTAEQIKMHLSVFSDSFIGLTGSQEELNKAYSGFGVYREKVAIAESAAGYLMNHTSSMYLLDKSGNWRIKHSNDAAPEDITHDLRLLIREDITEQKNHANN